MTMLDALRRALLGDDRLLSIAGERLAAREYAAAARDARTVLGRSPDHAQALETLAGALIGLDDMDGAADAWRRRRALDRGADWTVRLCHDALIRPELAAAGTAYVAELEDVVVDYEMDPERAAVIKVANWDYRIDVKAVLAVLRRERPELFPRRSSLAQA